MTIPYGKLRQFYSMKTRNIHKIITQSSCHMLNSPENYLNHVLTSGTQKHNMIEKRICAY